MLSIIVPANNESAYIGACISSLLSSTDVTDPVELIVAANACTDDTVEVARRFDDLVATRGWSFRVLDIKEPGKLNALNEADAVAQYPARLYVDADIVVEPALLKQIIERVRRNDPVYTSGQLRVAEARSWVTRCFARVWRELPFVKRAGVTGAGVFAVNGPARERWGKFPDVIADDYYVRLLFTDQEREGCSAGYDWPLVEGFRPLVRVRRRQNKGRDEILARFPDLAANEAQLSMSAWEHLKLAARMPVSYLVYLFVFALAKLPSRDGRDWVRGR